MAPTPPLPFEIKYAELSELNTLMDIRARSFPSSKYLSSTYKGCDPSAVQTFKAVSSLEYFVKPEGHVLASASCETGELLAYSLWHIPTVYNFQRAVDTSLSDATQIQIQNKSSYAPPQMNKGTYTLYDEKIKQSRAKHLKETDFGSSTSFINRLS